jgi:hypothetical protein
MKSGDIVQVKLRANVDEKLRGRKGTVSAGSEPDELVPVRMEDEGITHQFLAKDLERIKKAYEPPAFRFEIAFVTSALSCGKISGTEVNCHTNRKVS